MLDKATVKESLGAMKILAVLATDPEVLWLDIQGQWLGKETRDTVTGLENPVRELDATGIGLEQASHIWGILRDLQEFNARQPAEAAEVPHPNDTAVRHLYEAKAEFSALAHETGRGPAGRCYSIVLTDLEKLIHVEAGYFPRDLIIAGEETRTAPATDATKEKP